MGSVLVHVGHYGSGKTELSLDSALSAVQKGKQVTLVDLDIVNPYFRSGEHWEMLERTGVRVIMPNFEGTNVDVPSIPAEINSVFLQDCDVVFDAGGDPSGAAALGRFSRDLAESGAHVRCVVNARRPFTSTADDIVEMIGMIERRSRIRVNALVNNTNLALNTKPGDITEGQEIIEEAAGRLGLKIELICGLPRVIKALPEDFVCRYGDKIRPIKLRNRPDWMG